MPPQSKLAEAINRILYGPPGTGKTREAVRMAVKIADGGLSPSDKKFMPTSEILQRFKQLQESGQIAMVTFHQNYSYEDFIEGIKPVLSEKRGGRIAYQITDGIFKCIATDARDNTVDQDFGIDVHRLIISFAYTVDKNLGSDKQIVIKSKSGAERVIRPIWNNRNAPQSFRIDGLGTLPVAIIKRNYPDFKSGKINSPKHIALRRNKEGGHHTYAKCVLSLYERIRDYEESDEFRKGEYLFDMLPELLSRKRKNFVLIIDEINRGNIAKIFGELITLVEESKRLGNSDELSLTLPYSQEEFGVPNNLYIIGTMNTADRSIALLDTALRRRFEFMEMMPLAHKLPEEVDGILLREMLTKINKRIHALYDREHQIGHARLMKVATLDDLKQAFQTYVMPLLQEYFFDDWEKIDLVLNKNGFVQQEKITVGNAPKILYNILPQDNPNWNDPARYTKIYGPATDDSND